MKFLKTALSLTTSFLGLNAADQAFGELLSALGANAEPAAEKLAEALAEIDKMLSALDAELVRFLIIDPQGLDIAREDMQTLIELSAGKALVNIETARGHCSRIKLIYQAHLDGWISKNLQNPNSQAAIQRIFEDMQGADDSIIFAAEQVNEFLQYNAEEVLRLISENNVIDVKALIAEARDHTLPVRRELFGNMATLRRYEAAFRRAARVI
ncbi:MAG: hypothetical protein AAGA70_17590 [Pseudomonadota bacterium]